MHKLINEKGIIHDYTNLYWGHNCEWDRESIPVKFRDMETYANTGSTFSQIPLHNGDFIIRNMKSGRIGAFEISNIKGWDNIHDCYEGTYTFCGYYNSQDRKLELLINYGINPPSIVEEALGKIRRISRKE